MKDKIVIWMSLNRKPIGYTIGGLNLLVALNHLIQGEIGLAILWLVIGGMIVLDTNAHK